MSRKPEEVVGAVIVIEAVCHMFEMVPKKRGKVDPQKAQYDPQGYFETAQLNLLNEPAKLLQKFKDFDRENIPDKIVRKVMPILNREDVNTKKVANASKALLAFYLWISAMMKYNKVLKRVKPLREQAAKMDKELFRVRAYLAEKRKMLKEIDEKIEKLEQLFREKVEQETTLMNMINDCNVKVERASKLINGLQSEKDRWTETVTSLKIQFGNLIADCLVASGMVAYAGCFTSEFRGQLESEWINKLSDLKLTHDDSLSMRKLLGDEVKIRQWNVAGLPSDNLSLQNGIILFTARRWPLMIDPQNQANKFIKNLGKEHESNIDIFKSSEGNVVKQLETAIELGRWVLLENIGEKLAPSLDPILLMQRLEKGEPPKMARMGEKQIRYDHAFAFYLTTTLPSPHYAPQIAVKATLLNLGITPAGLEEQMLNQLVAQEMPELQEKKNRIVLQNAKSAKELRDIEDEILGALTANEDTSQILEDEKLINMLADSKKRSEDINERVMESKKTEAEIDQTRKKYKPVAYRASLLFFCITDLSQVDPMYQYSLQWFAKLFSLAIESAPASNVIINILFHLLLLGTLY